MAIFAKKKNEIHTVGFGLSKDNSNGDILDIILRNLDKLSLDRVEIRIRIDRYGDEWKPCYNVFKWKNQRHELIFGSFNVSDVKDWLEKELAEKNLKLT
jgi:hypothetical protein